MGMKELYKLLKEKLPKLSKEVFILILTLILLCLYFILSFRCEYKNKNGTIECGSEPQKIKKNSSN